MPRRPARLTYLLGPPGPVERGQHAVLDTKTPLHELDPSTLHAVIMELLRALPRHRQRPLWDRMNRVCQEYRFMHLTFKQDENKVAAWAALVLRAQVDPRNRCSAITLLQHREVALDRLGSLPQPRYNPAHRTLALKDRLPDIFAAMASFPCPCRKAQTTLPPTDTLNKWPRSLGALAVAVVGWHHQFRFSTARRLLAKAGAEIREIERRLRAPRSREFRPLPRRLPSRKSASNRT